MARKTPKNTTAGRVSRHITLDPALDAKLGAYAGAHRMEISQVVAEALRVALRGFSFRQEGPRVPGRPEQPPGAADGQDAA